MNLKDFRGSVQVNDNNSIKSHQTEHNTQGVVSPRNQTSNNQFYQQGFSQLQIAREGSLIATLQNQEIKNHNNSINSYKFQDLEPNQVDNFKQYISKLITMKEERKINGIYKKNVQITEKNELKCNIQIIKPYNPKLVPPDWNTAQRHSDATRVGMDQKPLPNHFETYEICPCCDNQIEKQSLNLFDDPIKLLFLGSGYPLYFDFIKQCIYIMIIILLISGSFNLYTNQLGKECILNNQHTITGEKLPYKLQKCHYNIISKYSYINKNVDMNYIYFQDILDYFTVIMLIITFIYFRRYQIYKDIECDVLDLTPSDYTVMIKNIPKNIRPNVLQQFLQDISPSQKSNATISNQDQDISATQDESEKFEKIQVTDINYVYIKNHSHVKQLDQAVKRFQMKSKRYDMDFEEILNTVFSSSLKGNSLLQNNITNSQNQNNSNNVMKENVDLDLLELERIMHEIEKNPNNFNGYAFVSFMSDKQRDQVLNFAEEIVGERSFLSYLCSSFLSSSLEECKELDFEGQKLQICKAPEPLEIIWDNIMTDDQHKSRKRLHSFIYTATTLLLYTVIIYFLNYNTGEQQTDKKDKSNNTTVLLHNFNFTSSDHFIPQKNYLEDEIYFYQNQSQFNNKSVSNEDHSQEIRSFVAQKLKQQKQIAFNDFENKTKTGIQHKHFLNGEEQQNQNQNREQQEANKYKIQESYIEENTEILNPIIQLIKDQFSNLTVSIFMILLNSLVVRYAFEFIVNNECYNTFSLYKINMAQKLSIALFISNALVTSFIAIYYSHNIYGNGGLIYIMIFYLALDTPFNCFIEIIDLWGNVKKVIKYFQQSKGKECTLTQEEANILCERPVHEIEICYAEIINTIYISVFFSPIIPVGMILCLFGFLLLYWTQKYIVIYKRSVKQQVSIKLSQEMTNSLEVIVGIYPISCSVFYFISSGTLTVLQIISIFCGVLYILIPSDLLIKNLFKFPNPKQEQQIYPIAYSRFKTTYSRLNPITSELANEKHYQMFSHNKSLNHNIYQNNNNYNGSLLSV
ncbi:hypothetical protein ABPG72_001594 [Tetrahymena utriculariae]